MASSERERWAVTLIGPHLHHDVERQVVFSADLYGFDSGGYGYLSRGNPQCLEIELVRRPDAEPRAPEMLHLAICGVPAQYGCDMAFQRDDAARRRKRLCVFDMDSTLVRQEVVDELARKCGLGEKVAAITHRAMNGELDFDAALRERVALLAGAPAVILGEVLARLELTPGAERLIAVLKRMGCRTAVLSGGFTDVTLPFARRLGLDHAHANTLDIANGVLTGKVLGPIVNRKRKAELLASIAAQEGVPLGEVMAIGDGANDLDMLHRAGLGVAFNAKPAVQRQAPVVLNQPRLDAVLYLLGIADEDVDQ